MQNRQREASARQRENVSTCKQTSDWKNKASALPNGRIMISTYSQDGGENGEKKNTKIIQWKQMEANGLNVP